MSAIHTLDELRDLQDMDLFSKIAMTEERIHEWQYQAPCGIEKGVVSFSGGKDSTVLLHIARRLYPDIPAVFSNTGLEYPEIQSFVKKHDNVTVVRPKMQFSEVISTYGYPLIGKEVAEAIYYARRIRPSAERERERDDGGVNLMAECPTSTHTHTHTQRGANEQSYAGNGQQETGLAWTRNQTSRGNEQWRDWRRGCL